MFSTDNVSIFPSKVVLYKELFANDGKRYTGKKSSLPKSTSHKGVVSNLAASRLREKINWLVFKSKNQKVTYPNGTISTNFRISFITLTLPTRQAHTDIEIKKVFDRFLTTIRQRYNMVDYVWKAELQKNQNIHFHLTTNVFLNHENVRIIWNNHINKLGYVKEYAKKFRSMTYEQYRIIRLANAKKHNKTLSESQIESAYNHGKKTNWLSPNSTDVKSVFRVENLGAYMAKYLSKKIAKSSSSSSEKKRLKNFGGRIWFCSRSLSRIKSYKSILSNPYHSLLVNLSKCVSTKIKEYDFCTVFYFDITKIPKFLQSQLTNLLNRYISSVAVA